MFRTARLAWELLDNRDRRNAALVLLLIVVAALSSAVMVGSFMPFLLVLSDPDSIHQNVLLSWAYESFGFTTEAGFLAAAGGATLTVIIFAALTQVLRSYAVARFSVMRMHNLSSRLIETYLNQPFEFFITRNSGALNTKILSETQAVMGQFFKPAAEAIAGVLTTTCVLMLLIIINPIVALLTFGVFAALYGAVYVAIRRILKRAGERRLAANMSRYKVAGEALSGAKFVKLGAHEKNFVARFENPSNSYARTQSLMIVLSETPQYVMQALAFGGGVAFLLGMISFQGLGSIALDESIPLIGLFAVAALRVMPELTKVYQSITKLQASGPAVEAVREDLALALDVEISEAGTRLLLQRALRLDNVTYHYPGSKGRGGISQVSATIKSGEKIGIVGGTGAGKTTLADVVLGLLKPATGRLVADNVEVTTQNVRAWRKTVGYVPQDIFLTDGTIAQNIAFGVEASAIDHERLIQSARIAQIYDFVLHDLPDGFQTEVGERGVRLSGGQRQRIGIARALYTDPDLIVFDEATSALDTLTERDVMSAIDALPGDKTVIVIAHRLSTVQNCDRILLLKGGRVQAIGTWSGLMRDCEDFRALSAASDA